MHLFSTAGGSIAGGIIGSLLGLVIVIIAPISVCVVCVVYNKRKTTVTCAPRTTTVNQPQSSPASVSITATTRFTTTSPKVCTVQPPSYGISSDCDSGEVSQRPPPYNEQFCQQSNQQLFDSRPPLPTLPYSQPSPQACYTMPAADPHSTFPTPYPYPYPHHGAATLTY